MATTSTRSSIHQHRGVAVIQLAASDFPSALDAATLAEACSAVEGWTTEAVVLDFSQVARVTEPGIALIVELRGRAPRAGLRLLLCGLSEWDADRLRIYGLAGCLFPDAAAALRDELAFRREVLCCA